MSDEDHEGVLVFAEQQEGEIHPVSYELIGKASELANELGTEVWSVLMGSKGMNVNELIHYGASKVFLYEDRAFSLPDEMLYKKNIVHLLKDEEPAIFLVGATHFGRSLAPRIAASLRIGLTADCTKLKIDEEGKLEQIRPAFSGNILAHINTDTYPQMATVRYGEFKKPEKKTERKGKVIRKEPEIPEDTGLKVLERVKAREVNLEREDVIVSGGKGLEKPEDFDVLRELAQLLKGEVGASRAVVDEGYIGRDHQVGYSGRRVKPKLYIACGISGASQHLVGMKDSEFVIAINTDQSAPIFRVSDLGIVGDLYEVVPSLCNKIRETEMHEGRSA